MSFASEFIVRVNVDLSVDRDVFFCNACVHTLSVAVLCLAYGFRFQADAVDALHMPRGVSQYLLS